MDEQGQYHIEELKGVFSPAPCGIGIFTLQTRHPLFLNSAYYRLFGYTPEEYDKLISNDDQKLIFAEDLPISQGNTERVSKTGSLSDAQFRIVRKGGEVSWVKLCITPIMVDGTSCALCFFENITSEKEQYAQLKLIVESIGSSICVMRIKNGTERILYANETFFNLIGIDREKYLKDAPSFDYAFASEEDRLKIHDAIRKSLQTGKPQELTYRFLRPGASPMWMQRRLSVIREDEENTYLMVSISTDITEKKKTELAIALEQRRYELVVNEIKAAVFEWDLQSGAFYCSDSYHEYDMSTIPPDVILANKGSGETIHPDDRQSMLQFFADIASGAPRAEAVLRMKLTAGGYRWCRLIGLFYKDEKGCATRTLGMIININEERDKSFMLDSLLNELPGGVAVFKIGETLECQYYNDSFARLSNRTRAELDAVLQSGHFLETVVALPDLERFVKTIQVDTAIGSQINITYRFLTKEGRLGWLHMNASKLREEDGCPVYYCVFTSPSEETMLYRDVVEDSATGVFIAEQKTRRIVYCNKTMRHLYRIPPETTIIGLLLFDVIAQDTALLSPEEVAALSEDRYTEYHRLHEDRYLNIRAKKLIWNGIESYILYLSDETQEHQKRIEQETLLNLVPVGIGIYEASQGNIKQLYMNDSYYRMIGETREKRAKKQDDFLHLVYPNDLTKVYDLVEKCTAGSDQEYIDHRVLCGDGKYRWFRLTASVVKRENDKTTLYCSYVDINDAVNTKSALETANSELQKQYNQELYQREMLEKDSMVAVQFNVTKDKLVSYRVKQDLVQIFDLGTAGTTIRPNLFGSIPTAEERRIASDFFDRDQAISRYQNGTREFTAEYRRRFNNGRLHWVCSTCRLAKDEESGDIISYTYMHDIDTQRKKELAIESVIDEETDFVVLLNTVSGTAMLLKLRNNYQGSNGRLYQEFPFEDALDMGELNIIEYEDRAAALTFFNQESLVELLSREPVASITYRHRYIDGTIRRKKTRAFYLDETHEDIVIARRDITDLYEEEQEQKRTLEAALAAANSANHSKSDFLSRMSHDLRTPMNVIIGSASLAMDSINDPVETEKALTNITNSSKYLLGLINDCLDIEKINSGKIELHPAPYPYIDFYNDIKAVIEPLCRQKNITLVMEKVENVSSVIVADKTRIEQIFYNLLSNAVKFTPAGGTIEMLTHNIVVRDGIVSYDSIVRDNGIGMSKEFQAHMFEAFAQEKTNVTPEYQGTGLGLAIVKQLVDLMGGLITIKSKLNKGTEYSIHFSFPTSQETDVNVGEKAHMSTNSLCGKRILLVEDHPLNRMIAQKLLEKVGITVTTAENGQDATARFESVAENFFDAILMDIRMPVMNGLEATRAIRSLGRTDAKTVPIIAMTANAFDPDIEESFHAGMNAHLSKPIEPDKLYETLTKLIW